MTHSWHTPPPKNKAPQFTCFLMTIHSTVAWRGRREEMEGGQAQPAGQPGRLLRACCFPPGVLLTRSEQQSRRQQLWPETSPLTPSQLMNCKDPEGVGEEWLPWDVQRGLSFYEFSIFNQVSWFGQDKIFQIKYRTVQRCPKLNS